MSMAKRAMIEAVAGSQEGHFDIARFDLSAEALVKAEERSL